MIYFLIYLFSTICLFIWIAQLFFVRIHYGWTDKNIECPKDYENVGISFIHPIKGIDCEFRKNVESWLNQNFEGKIQHIFSFQDANDPAIRIIESIKKQYARADIQIIVNPIIPDMTGKSSNMINGVKRARYDLLIFTDSDISVTRDFVVKMIMPLKNNSVGAVACGQIFVGGKNFWTRLFTYFQNNGNNFVWAFFTKFGMDVGLAGAAFAMRKKVVEGMGGLESFGNSLLEDFYLGKQLVKNGYKIVIGPFVSGRIEAIDKESVCNCIYRTAGGISIHDSLSRMQLILLIGWYWVVLITGLILNNSNLFVLSLFFILMRIVSGLAQRVLTKNKIMPVDLIIPLLSDLLELFSFIAPYRRYLVWRGIRYKVYRNGYVEMVSINK